MRPATDITYARGVADRVARDVNGYPYFIQWYGEALWEAADLEGTAAITAKLYERERVAIQGSLDEEFFEPRYRDARQADQGTLRVAASLGGERFTKAELDAATGRSTGALSQSLIRLIADNIVYRDDHGVYAYTAPMFGDFMRRRHLTAPGRRVTGRHKMGQRGDARPREGPMPCRMRSGFLSRSSHGAPRSRCRQPCRHGRLARTEVWMVEPAAELETPAERPGSRSYPHRQRDGRAARPRPACGKHVGRPRKPQS